MTDQPEQRAKVVEEDQVLRVDLADILTIREVDGVKATLLDVSTSKSPVLLHGQQLSRVDAAGLQLLAALIHERQQAGLSTSWADTSDQLVISAERLGISTLLGLTHDQQF